VSSGDSMNTTIRRSGLFFRVTTPTRCTSSGSRGCAIATRFCTSTCALSRSVPSLKVTVMLSWPFEVAWLYMYSMSSTPLISCSIGVATVSDTVCAEAPGYCVVITTVGGATCGYSATGSVV
jgi:hypothetical protein